MMNSVKARIKDISRGIVPAGYKQTRLGIIPETWDALELNTVLTESKARNRNNLYSKNDVLSVSGEMGITNQIDLLGRSFAGESVLEYHVVEHGDVVYTKSPLKANPYGIIKQNKGQAGIVSTLYAVYHPRNYSAGTYLDYYFSLDRNVNNYLRPLVRKGTKNDMKINNEDALKGLIIFPPEKECDRILEILECCDKVICLKRELIEAKKKQKKALMQKLLDSNSGFRLPGFNGEWESVSLEDCGTWTGGGTPSKQNPAFWENGTIKWISSQEVKVRLLLNTTFKITERAIQESTSNLVSSNSLIFVTRSGVLQHSFPIAKIIEPMAINQDIKALTPNEKIEIDFLQYFLEYHELDIIRNYIKAGTTVESLMFDDFKKMTIRVPEKAEQKAIVKVLSSSDHELDLLEQDLTQWELKKKSLMQLLLTGKVRA